MKSFVAALAFAIVAAVAWGVELDGFPAGLYAVAENALLWTAGVVAVAGTARARLAPGGIPGRRGLPAATRSSKSR